MKRIERYTSCLKKRWINKFGVVQPVGGLTALGGGNFANDLLNNGLVEGGIRCLSKGYSREQCAVEDGGRKHNGSEGNETERDAGKKRSVKDYD